MKTIAFGASSSKNSINKQFAVWSANQISKEVTTLDLNDFEMPIYSIDKELENGVPLEALQFAHVIDEAELIVISFAEHNGAYTVAFKNIFDWISRIPNRKAWNDKKMFLLSTSEGALGGSTVLEIATKRFPFNGGNVVASFSLPNFSENFSLEDGIVNENLKIQFFTLIENLS